jgi:hypothetical protein
MDGPPKRRPYNAAPIIGSPLSDPGLHSLSTSPQTFFIERTQSLDSLHEQDLRDTREHMERSPSNFSEIDVILDDGTTQKRTVSLSTLPDEEQQRQHHHHYHSNRRRSR